MEAKFFAHTLCCYSFCFIKINDIPFLSLGSIVAPYLDRVAFNVFTSSDIKDLIVRPVDELVVLILEDLEPS